MMKLGQNPGMKAMVLHSPGPEGRYVLEDVAQPRAKHGQLLIKVACAGINRADLFQKQKKYPLPEGDVMIPGLELAGHVEAVGDEVRGFKKGDAVCALVGQGAFAEYCAVSATQVLPVPKGWSMREAATLPEALFTYWLALVDKAAVQEGETILIHGGSGGIGVIGLQLAKMLGARVFATAGTLKKCHQCVALGAEHAIWYKEEDFVSIIQSLTRERGVNVVIDPVGGDYFAKNLSLLAWGGRMVMLAVLKGAKVEANLGQILVKNLSVHGITLRARPEEEKAEIARELHEVVWPWLDSRRVQPVLDTVFPLEEAEKALKHMEQGLNLGKIVLELAS